MAVILPIIQSPDSRLLSRSRPVSRGSGIGNLIGDLIDTRVKHNGAGLAAVQVGVPLCVIALSPAHFGIKIMLNPEIVESGGETVESIEGCLSIGFGKPKFKVVRHRRVVVSYRNRDWEQKTITAEDQAAFILQHEIDHLDGKLIA